MLAGAAAEAVQAYIQDAHTDSLGRDSEDAEVVAEAEACDGSSDYTSRDAREAGCSQDTERDCEDERAVEELAQVSKRRDCCSV